MLSGLRRGSAILAALGCAASLAVLPATAASADAIRDNQQWVLNMMNVPAAWPVTRGGGVTVAVIDSGVYRYVSDLAGSVTDGPDYTGVATRRSDRNWGVHVHDGQHPLLVVPDGVGGRGGGGQHRERRGAEERGQDRARPAEPGQHPGVPGQCGLAGAAASVSSTDWATPSARPVISS